VSALGDYITPLASMRFVVGIEPIARMLVAAREWLPDLKSLTGRGIEVRGLGGRAACVGGRGRAVFWVAAGP